MLNINLKIKYISTTSDITQCNELINSFKNNDADYHIIEHRWYGFLGKLIETYNYVKELPGEYTHFVYTDAWDSVMIKKVPLWQIVPSDGIILSAEKACYPHPELAAEYPETESAWKYVNGGGWVCNIDAFINLMELEPPKEEMNDQVWWTKMFLKFPDRIFLDYDCEIFQTIGFCEMQKEFKFTNSSAGKKILYNVERKSFPCFVHGNGHTPMDEIYSNL